MRHLSLISLALLISVLFQLPTYGSLRASSINGELLIKLRKTTNQSYDYNFHRQLGMELVRDYPAVGWAIGKITIWNDF